GGAAPADPEAFGEAPAQQQWGTAPAAGDEEYGSGPAHAPGAWGAEGARGPSFEGTQAMPAVGRDDPLGPPGEYGGPERFDGPDAFGGPERPAPGRPGPDGPEPGPWSGDQQWGDQWGRQQAPAPGGWEPEGPATQQWGAAPEQGYADQGYADQGYGDRGYADQGYDDRYDEQYGDRYDDGYGGHDGGPQGGDAQGRRGRRDRVAEDFPGFEDRPPGGNAGDDYPGYDSIDDVWAEPDTGAAAAMWLGVIGLIPVIGLFTSVAAVIVGPRAVRRIRSSHGEFEGEGQARTGTILGWVGLGLFVVEAIAAAAYFLVL
ncbi:DUF4190 domain-containing protein, partial [Nocardiopsis sp. RSe5-2]